MRLSIFFSIVCQFLISCVNSLDCYTKNEIANNYLVDESIFWIEINDNISLELISSQVDSVVLVDAARISYSLDSGHLKLTTKRCLNVTDQPRVKWFLTNDEIRIVSKSIGEIKSDNLRSNIYLSAYDFSGIVKLDVSNNWVVVDSNSSSNFYLSGTTKSLRMSTAFSDGIMDAKDLKAEKVELLHKGYNDMIVTCEELLEVRIETAGRVIYYGNPNVDSFVSNGGQLIKGK